MNVPGIVVWTCGLLIATSAWAQDASTPEPSAPTSPGDATLEQELTKFRDGLFQQFNDGHYQQMLEQYCHPEVIATWQDGTTSRGHAGVLAEFDKLKQFIRQMQVHPNTDQRLVLDGGRLVVSSGEVKDDYRLSRGPTVQLHSRWSATLVKSDDRWLLISFSASTNAFDNEVITLYLQAAKYQWSAIAGIAGLIVGAILMKLLSGKKTTTQAST